MIRFNHMIILLGKHPPKMNKYIISPVSFVVICALENFIWAKD